MRKVVPRFCVTTCICVPHLFGKTWQIAWVAIVQLGTSLQPHVVSQGILTRSFWRVLACGPERNPGIFNTKNLSVGRLNCYWSSPAQSRRYPWPRFLFSSRHVRVLRWDPLFDERRGLTTTGHSPSAGSDSSGTHSLAGPHLLSLSLSLRIPLTVGRINCWWPWPAQSFLFTSQPFTVESPI
jgi:hypothetical protein